MFPTTRWTLIQQVNEASLSESRRALAELCRQYASPVLGFVRSRVSSPERAEDATQEFFTWLIEGSLLERADRERGRFRTFLLHAVRGFLADQYDNERAVRRGGNVEHVALETNMVADTRNGMTAEQQFDRQWVRTLLTTAVAQLQQEYIESGRGDLFTALQGALDHTEKVSADETGRRLRMTSAAVRVALHRMRLRLGRIIRQQILDTVDSPDDIDEEIGNLLQVLETNS